MTDTASTDLIHARPLDGQLVPAPGTWVVDRSHSAVTFSARHLMVSKVRGEFLDWDATVVIADRPEDSRVEVTLQAASIDTGDEQRDGHLRSPDFLDVDAHPTLSYRSTRVVAEGDGRYRIEGDLTIVGVTQPVIVDAEYTGIVRDPWGNEKAGFEGRAEIDREAFGLTWNQALESGGVLVGKRVRIEFDLELAPPAS